MKLKISDNISLPLDAVTQTFAIMAKRGVGKTHTASVMAEEMLKQGQPIVVYDPTSAWWGLKSSVDGKRPGFPVVIFGGEHADVPLEETAGDTIANVIVERRIPAILDCGLLRKGARIRFMTDFCETLYHKNREPLHLFIDEAQTVAPQNLKAMPEIARLVGALEDIILQGRRRGLGVTVISPRPAIVNTSVRSACEVLIAMQIVGPHDRKAIQEWIDLHGDDADQAKEMMATLASLKRGEAWVWSPAWLELFTRTKFRKRETFDSSATPEVGHKIMAPKEMAAVDLEKLGKDIQATVQRAKDNNPKELQKRIAQLEQQLKSAPVKTESKRVEVPVLREGEIKQLKQFIGIIENCAKHYNNAKYTMESALDNANTIVENIRRLINRLINPNPAPVPAPVAKVVRTSPKATARKPAVAGDLHPAAVKMLTALERNYPNIYTWEEVACLAGIIPGNGYFYGGKKSLLESGRIYEQEGHVGAENGGNINPTSKDEIVMMWSRKLKPPAPDMLAVIYERSEIQVNDLAEAIGKKPGNGYWYGGVAALREAGLIEQNSSTLRLASILMR